MATINDILRSEGKTISVSSGYRHWVTRKNASDMSLTNIDDTDWTKEQLDQYRSLINKSKGFCNTLIGLKLFKLGVDDDTNIKACKQVYANGIENAERIFTQNRPPKHIRGKKSVSKSGPSLQFVYGKFFGEGTFDSDLELAKRGWHSYDKGFVELLHEGLPKSAYLTTCHEAKQLVGFLYYLKASEAKRQTILSDEITRILAVNQVYSTFKPATLNPLGFDDKRFMKKQAEDRYRDLYALSQDATLDIKPEDYKHLRTLSEVGYINGKIKDAKTIALHETANFALEGMGLGLYHYNPSSNRIGRHAARGYNRMLTKINSAYKQYDKLLKKGFDPDTARATAKQIIEFWLKDANNTDRLWTVFERKDWQKPAPIQPQKAKTTKKRNKSTADSLEKLRQLKQTESEASNER